MAWKDVLGALRAVDRLLELEKKHGALIEAQQHRLDHLAERVQRLESREEILVARAEAAAGAAASRVAAHHVGDLARLAGGLDERVKRLEGGNRASRALPRSRD